jgi:crossover junction endodeoxyribonuclease RusA
MIHLNLPYPPSINNYWIASGHRRFISQRGRDFKNDVAAYCKEWRVPNYGDQPVWVEIILRPRSKKLMDIDNCVKPILDSLIGIVYTDDVSVQQIIVKRGLPIKNGGCTVMVGLMEDVVPPQA